ncbi:MAG: hypothetical protein AAF909_11490, partial [Pseudomonadota bacterium]
MTDQNRLEEIIRTARAAASGGVILKGAAGDKLAAVDLWETMADGGRRLRTELLAPPPLSASGLGA